MSNSNQNILKEIQIQDDYSMSSKNKSYNSNYSKDNESFESLSIINSNPKDSINLKFENEVDLTTSNLEEKVDMKLSMKQDREEAIEKSFNSEKVQATCIMINEFIYDLLLECKDKIQVKSKNDSTNCNINVFYGRIPNYSIQEYILRIAKYAILDENELVFLAMIIKAIKSKNVLLEISNIYKIINGSLMLTVKYLKDKKFKNSDYARVTGETIKDLFCLEYNILAILDFNLFNLDKNFQMFKEEFFDEYSQYV
jgi:hypothetical protein